MKKMLTLFVFVLFLVGVSNAQTTIANWTFETSIPTTGGPLNPEVGSGSASSNTAGTFSNPVGNGSVESWSSNNWNIGEYYEFSFSTTGFLEISITWSQTSSSTGPKEFKVQYSTDGSSFTDLSGGAYDVLLNGAPNTAWSSAASNPAMVYTYNLNTVTEVENAATVYIRLTNTSTVSTNGGTVAATGTCRVDGFTASYGTLLPVELTSFTAIAKGKNVELQWNTATELNNYGFEVEKNVSGSWSKIGFVEGNGTTNAPKSYSYADANVRGTVQYRLKQVDRDGQFEYSPVVEATVADIKTFGLDQNYPNPFNPATVISYQLPVSGQVSLKVYDMLGKEVASLVNETKEAGSYSAKFDGSQLSSGIYFYTLQSGNFTATKKLTLMK